MSKIREIIQAENGIIRIGTHDGIFHADEVFAVALIQDACKALGKKFETIRSRDTAMLDGCTLRVDVGGKYSPGTGDFDHHHEKSLPAAFGLVYQDLMLMCPLNDMSEPFFTEFVAGIDVMDTNPTSVTLPEQPIRNLSQIISGFNNLAKNQDVQFSLAVSVAEIILENEFRSAQDKGRAEIEYFNRESLPNGVAVFSEFSPIWKDKGEHEFAVMPHPSGWQIVARDTNTAIVPESVSKSKDFIFRHQSGFMATFKTKEAAILQAAKI